jgi:hypothetical protein
MKLITLMINNGLTFQQEIIRDIPPDSVLEIITPSLCFEADDDYILEEDVNFTVD